MSYIKSKSVVFMKIAKKLEIWNNIVINDINEKEFVWYYIDKKLIYLCYWNENIKIDYCYFYTCLVFF